MTWQDSQPTLIERCAVLFSRRHGGGQRQSFSPVQIHTADRQAIVGQRGRTTPDIGRAVREGVDRSRPLIGSTAPIFGAAIADHDWRLACRLGLAFLATASLRSAEVNARSPCGLGPDMGYPPAGNLFVRLVSPGRDLLYPVTVTGYRFDATHRQSRRLSRIRGWMAIANLKTIRGTPRRPWRRLPPVAEPSPTYGFRRVGY
jgi:hypothetical protein